jgi:hypothetical protein
MVVEQKAAALAMLGIASTVALRATVSEGDL